MVAVYKTVPVNDVVPAITTADAPAHACLLHGQVPLAKYLGILRKQFVFQFLLHHFGYCPDDVLVLRTTQEA